MATTKRYYKPNTDILHREDGPAIEYSMGGKVWYQNGLLHRLDGPATEFPNGYKEYYINNIQYSEKEYSVYN